MDSVVILVAYSERLKWESIVHEDEKYSAFLLFLKAGVVCNSHMQNGTDRN